MKGQLRLSRSSSMASFAPSGGSFDPTPPRLVPHLWIESAAVHTIRPTSPPKGTGDDEVPLAIELPTARHRKGGKIEPLPPTIVGEKDTVIQPELLCIPTPSSSSEFRSKEKRGSRG